MKDILKVMGSYFAVGFGTLVGVGAGMKVCDKLLNKKSKKPYGRITKEHPKN